MGQSSHWLVFTGARHRSLWIFTTISHDPQFHVSPRPPLSWNCWKIATNAVHKLDHLTMFYKQSLIKSQVSVRYVKKFAL